MNIDELLNKVKDVKPKTVWIDPYDCDDLLGELDLMGLNIGSFESDRLTTKRVCSWTFTDTMVGLEVMFLDKIPAALRFKRYRKGDFDFLWISVEEKRRVFDYFISLVQQNETALPRFLATEPAIDAILEWISDYEYKEHFSTCW
jgi:hypothetical protein